MSFQYPAIINPGQITNTEISATADISMSKLSSPRTKTGSFTRDMTIASGTQAITGVGFQPEGILFFAHVSSGTAQASWGMDDATLGCGFYDAGALTADTYQTSDTWGIACIVGVGTNYLGVVSARGTDGFTITWTKTGSPTGTLVIKYIAFR